MFVPARKLAEICAQAGRAALKARGLAEAAAGVESYRAGYAPAERRDLERRLQGGFITCVVATSALELGIDVGSLDAVVHVGCPDTGAQQWQQAGRAGRRGADSLSLVIAAERPLDTFFLAQPASLVARTAEPVHIDPGNGALLALHLPCAGAEAPLVADDARHFGGIEPLARALRAAVQARRREAGLGRCWCWCPLLIIAHARAASPAPPSVLPSISPGQAAAVQRVHPVVRAARG